VTFQCTSMLSRKQDIHVANFDLQQMLHPNHSVKRLSFHGLEERLDR